MEQLIDSRLPVLYVPEAENTRIPDASGSFIEANTVEVGLRDIKDNHIIPVFVKDNEPLISHAEFVDMTWELVNNIYTGEQISMPGIRVSHPIKGRIPEAKDKPASQLMEWEKTLYYERMAFVIEVPSIRDMVDGNSLSLTIGGVKSYGQDNLYSRGTSDQHFKVFIGFKNKVCTNLCIWTDGYMGDLKVRNHGQLKAAIRTLIEGYDQNYHLHGLRKLTEHGLTETQFAQVIGRSRMYPYLPSSMKAEVPPMLFGDQQLGAVVKDYYKDQSFCRDTQGNINLWKLYNLFTGVNKSSYIDSFLDRNVSAFQLVEQIRYGLEKRSSCWYLG